MGDPADGSILHEPEIMFGEDLLVPDLAGWRKDHFPDGPEENWFSTAPDWICEMLSPVTARMDRIRKMPIYARHSVHHVWLIDPVIKTLEVFGLESGHWLLLGAHAENEAVRAVPFREIEISLGCLWLE